MRGQRKRRRLTKGLPRRTTETDDHVYCYPDWIAEKGADDVWLTLLYGGWMRSFRDLLHLGLTCRTLRDKVMALDLVHMRLYYRIRLHVGPAEVTDASALESLAESLHLSAHQSVWAWCEVDRKRDVLHFRRIPLDERTDGLTHALSFQPVMAMPCRLRPALLKCVPFGVGEVSGTPCWRLDVQPIRAGGEADDHAMRAASRVVECRLPALSVLWDNLVCANQVGEGSSWKFLIARFPNGQFCRRIEINASL